jgi:hypothetical protein
VERKKFKVILSQTACTSPAWATRSPVSKKKKKKKEKGRKEGRKKEKKKEIGEETPGPVVSHP